MTKTLTLNERAQLIVDQLVDRANDLRIDLHTINGARVLDCGVEAVGGIQAGLGLGRVCLAGLGEVSLQPPTIPGVLCPQIQVVSDQPVLACLASQYAGWEVSLEGFFGMGSGPMRAAYGKEALFDDISGREQPSVAVGVLETRKVPTDEVIAYLAQNVGLDSTRLTLLVAPASSLAGTIQVVARSVETALHKLHELKFDLSQIVFGYGTAPLPPVSPDDLLAIGRINDALLYGGQVQLWVRCEDDQLAEMGPRIPSSASSDHGEPFAKIFGRYKMDFYKIDPMLFSPAIITFQNLNSGRTHTFGRLEQEVLQRSFFGE